MSWASLSNDIVFEAKTSPIELSHKLNVANFVQQDLLTGKPRLQRLGTNLQEIKLKCKFHFSVTPYYKLEAAIKAAAENGEVLQWISGTGEAYGDFVIKEIEKKILKTDETGKDYAAEYDLVLIEYAGPGVAEQTKIDLRKRAFANKVVTLPKTTALVSNPSDVAGKNIQVMKVQNVKVQKKLSLLSKGQMSLKEFKRQVVPILGKIQKAKNNTDSAIAIAKNLKNAPSLTSALSLVGVATDSLGLAVGNNGTLSQISGAANDLSAVTGSLDNAAQPMNAAKSWWPNAGIFK